MKQLLVCYRFCAISCFRRLDEGGKKKLSQHKLYRSLEKQKATKQDQLQMWRIQWGIFIYHRCQHIKYLRSGLTRALSSPQWSIMRRTNTIKNWRRAKINLKGYCNTQKDHSYQRVSYWRTWEDFCDLATSSLMQPLHFFTHCLPTYKPTEPPGLHCVKLCFFPFLFSRPFSQHPSSVLRSELQREPPTVPRWWGPLLVGPAAQETALHSPS